MPTPTSPWSIAYADGSANAYHFQSDGDGATFEYVPVSKEQSSTGMYSGGPPRKGRLDAQTVARLWQQVEALEGNTALHQKDRNKGTGQFSIDAGGKRDLIVAMGDEIKAFDAFVRGLS